LTPEFVNIKKRTVIRFEPFWCVAADRAAAAPGRSLLDRARPAPFTTAASEKGFAMPSPTTAARLAGAALILGLAACAPTTQLPSQTVALPVAWPVPSLADAPAVSRADWWTALGDPVLDSIVAAALADSPSLQQALARVEAARAFARSTNAGRLPQVNAGGRIDLDRRLTSDTSGSVVGGVATQSSPALTGVGSGQVQVSWEADLFGRLASQSRGAEADARVAAARAAGARIALISDIVEAYVDLRVAQERLALVEKSVATQTRLVELVGARAKAGLTSDFELNRARTSLAQAEAEAPTARELAGRALQRLAILAGRAEPDASWSSGKTVPNLAAFAIEAAPADLLRLRPDVRAAEAQVASAAADVGVATAELYPRLSLDGSVGVTTSVLNQSIPAARSVASLVPSLQIPLFDWGQRRAVVVARQAQLKESIYAYRETVLAAYGEARNAMDSAVQQRQRANSLKAAQGTASAALTQAETLYTRGLTGLTERLDAESQALRTDLDELAARQAAASAVISLHRALGAHSEEAAISPPQQNLGSSSVQ
jgi:outer membrane protein, multidrug efflux system